MFKERLNLYIVVVDSSSDQKGLIRRFLKLFKSVHSGILSLITKEHFKLHVVFFFQVLVVKPRPNEMAKNCYQNSQFILLYEKNHSEQFSLGFMYNLSLQLKDSVKSRTGIQFNWCLKI